ncbi:hypothetical protein N9A22_04380 [Methylophilaceae bacterium]|nr:hypothetical protein [Methylophilaceae bacterium]
MKKLLLLILLIPNLVMANPLCFSYYNTKDKRDKKLNHIINLLNKDYISQIEIPPPHEIKKMDTLNDEFNEESFRESYNNKFYPAYEVQKAFSEVKEESLRSPSEMLNLLILSMNMQKMKETLYHYKERNPISDLKIRDMSFSFKVWNSMIKDMGECAADI